MLFSNHKLKLTALFAFTLTQISLFTACGGGHVPVEASNDSSHPRVGKSIDQKAVATKSTLEGMIYLSTNGRASNTKQAQKLILTYNETKDAFTSDQTFVAQAPMDDVISFSLLTETQKVTDFKTRVSAKVAHSHGTQTIRATVIPLGTNDSLTIEMRGLSQAMPKEMGQRSTIRVQITSETNSRNIEISFMGPARPPELNLETLSEQKAPITIHEIDEKEGAVYFGKIRLTNSNEMSLLLSPSLTAPSEVFLNTLRTVHSTSEGCRNQSATAPAKTKLEGTLLYVPEFMPVSDFVKANIRTQRKNSTVEIEASQTVAFDLYFLTSRETAFNLLKNEINVGPPKSLPNACVSSGVCAVKEIGCHDANHNSEWITFFDCDRNGGCSQRNRGSSPECSERNRREINCAIWHQNIAGFAEYQDTEVLSSLSINLKEIFPETKFGYNESSVSKASWKFQQSDQNQIEFEMPAKIARD